MQIQPHDIHVWSVDLIGTLEAEQKAFALLSLDEQERALRFRFAIHQTRFTFARATLRKIISLYVDMPPDEIAFHYNNQKKPSLARPLEPPLHFNLSHSENIAIYAFTLNHDIGIDIEKIADKYDADVAARYFSKQENNLLQQATPEQQTPIFYQLWSRKEALIKAAGKGLHIPLSSFSVPLTETVAKVVVEEQAWSLLPLSIHPAFAAAVASNQKIQNLHHWIYFNHGIKQEKIISF